MDAFARRGLPAGGCCATSTRWISRHPARTTDPLSACPRSTGFTRIVHPDGGPEVARAAAQPGIPYSLSTLGTRSIEEVRAASDGRLLFQVGGGGDYPDDFAAAVSATQRARGVSRASPSGSSEGSGPLNRSTTPGVTSTTTDCVSIPLRHSQAVPLSW